MGHAYTGRSPLVHRSAADEWGTELPMRQVETAPETGFNACRLRRIVSPARAFGCENVMQTKRLSPRRTVP